MDLVQDIGSSFWQSLFFGLARFVDTLGWIYGWILIIRILITWVQPDPYNPIVRFLGQMSDPYLNWFRRKLPFLRIGMMDLSPIAAIIALQAVTYFLVRVLTRIGQAF